MVCIYCRSKTRVANSRSSSKKLVTWRRRHCIKCGAIFTTEEKPDLQKSIVVKGPNGDLSPLQRDRLFVSVLRSISHRKSALSDASGLTDTILGRSLVSSSRGVVESSELRTIAFEVLERFDTAAAVHYKAYHL